jgi:AcrR family transcriptional regulator
MPRAGRGGRYHHGDLRTALIETTIELIGERGVRDFSVAEASRRLGVAASAPYAHFADRDQLLAAVTVRAYESLLAEIEPAMEGIRAPAERLAAMARGYVRFAATNRALFEVLYEAGLNKTSHPEIEVAEGPLADALLDCVRALTGSGDQQADDQQPDDQQPDDQQPDDQQADDQQADDLATAIEAAARGFALLLLDGDFGAGTDAVERAAERAARATLALIEGRHLLTGS